MGGYIDLQGITEQAVVWCGRIQDLGVIRIRLACNFPLPVHHGLRVHEYGLEKMLP